MAWQKGPLPKGTYNWGAVVPKGVKSGFFFADFHGDHVVIPGGRDGSGDEKVKAADVEWYDNSLTLPPTSVGRVATPEKDS